MPEQDLIFDDLPSVLRGLKLDSSSHDAEVLLLTCIDFRFFHKVDEHIEAEGLTGKFDHVIIAGAELGAVVDFPPTPKLHWQQFFLEHLALSKELHNIKKVLVLGHKDCGAYKKFGVLPENPTPDVERAAHKHHADRLEALVKRFHSDLEVDKYLLDLGSAPADPLKLLRFA
jgi:carbonic anhydrase